MSYSVSMKTDHHRIVGRTAARSMSYVVMILGPPQHIDFVNFWPGLTWPTGIILIAAGTSI